MTATTSTAVRSGTRDAADARTAVRRQRPSHWGTYLFLTVLAVMWLVPLVWTLYTSLRPKADTDKFGYFSIGGTYNFQNFVDAWNQGGFVNYLWNSVLITVPTVLLIAFTAGNLLPPQVLAAPLFEAFKLFKLPYSVSDSGSLLNQLYSVVAVDTAFQIGFCTFVLSNYMKALPGELTEAARVDGAGIWTQYARVVMPLTRPALAALGTLEVIFIYNDFFWPLILIQRGDRLPITTAINNLQGEFLSNYNLLAAGATITLIPTLIVYLLLQRQFVAGLTLGASKG
jgi:multiple sugar transport system permease protein